MKIKTGTAFGQCFFSLTWRLPVLINNLLGGASMKKVIYGMSFPKKVAHKYLSRNATNIREHITQCVVYKETLSDQLDHWIKDELCLWLENASQIKCSSKLKEKDLFETIFSELGTTLGDARVNLNIFKEDHCQEDSKKPYPDFEITQSLIENLFTACSEFKAVSEPILLSKNELTKDEWYELIRPIFIS